MAKGNIFVDRKVMAVCISLLIALVGFICLKTLPIEQYPDIAPPTVMISTSYSGADANTVMKSVVGERRGEHGVHDFGGFGYR